MTRPILPLLLIAASGCGSGLHIPLAPYYSPTALDPEAADVRLDVRYRTDAAADEHKHRLDLFLPSGSGWPILAFVHGGSLEEGDTTKRFVGHDIYRNIGRFYAARGVGVALVNYRLQPEVTWLEQVDDVAGATAWLVEHGRRLGSDGRLYLSGHSVGAWLSAHVALDEEIQRRHAFEAADITEVISISGSGFDLTDEQTWEMFGRLKRWRRRFSVGPDDTDWKQRASVVPLIDDHAPPFLLLYSSREWPALARQNQLFCSALVAAKLPCELQQIDGPGHRGMVLALSREDRSLSQRILRELGIEPDSHHETARNSTVGNSPASSSTRVGRAASGD